MPFDTDVNKLTREELRDTLHRIKLVLSKTVMVNTLPDQGLQLHQLKEKLEKEIRFRDGLETTIKHVREMSLTASNPNLLDLHSTKLCYVEKEPERERFKPYSSLKLPETGQTESQKQLHNRTKLIDLTTSLSIQKCQDKRLKEEQFRAKQERLSNLLNQQENDSDESTPEWGLDDDDSNEMSQEEEVAEQEGGGVDILYARDEPSSSGLGKHKNLKKKHRGEENEFIQLEEEIQSKTDDTKQKAEAGELKEEHKSSKQTMQPNVNKIEDKKT